MSADDLHHDWLRLIEISGPFLAVPVLKEVFPTGLEGLDGLKRKRLRQTYEEWREALETGDPQIPELHAAWVDEVLSRGLELDADRRVSVLKRADWCAANLATELPEHAITLSPDMAVVDELRANQPLLLIQVFAQDTDLDATRKLDGWAATPAERMVQLCRATGCRLGLVTNGERWMLIDAPVGAVTSFASWYARIWAQEPVTLQAFVHLLGIRRFFGDEAERLPALLDRSLKYQDEVTEALGEQVRRAVEVLIQALDKSDQDRHRELLLNVTAPELYEAALTVMMRLVFLLAAEERGLLLLGDERYEANYAISTLRMQLTAESDGVLERRWDAWSRLLATFRAVFGGIEHENLRLPALGGSLFDPDRFPFLEGRVKGSNWRTDMAKPLPIDNRTVLLLLRAIQQFEGRTLSYAGLDVEQVGHVYEGLLERTVKRTDEVTLELDGTRNARAPWIKVTELESATAEGVDRLAELLQDRSGSSTSRIRNDLAKPVDDALAGRLLAACHGDAELRDRIQRYAHLVRTDPWGYPLVYPAGSFIVTTGSDRRETGAHYTPKSLTEAIVIETLTPVVYVGPAEGTPRDQWVLKSPSEILELKICDPAMGSGAFLVQACRWLAERLVEAWSLAETTGRVVSVDGAVLDAANGKELLPRDIDARTTIARRLIAERCLYGVDLNPLAVELAKLSIWLVTLAKGRPFGFLDHNLRSGNSLLGIHRLDQLTELSMSPTGKGQRRLFGQDIERAVHEAIELRQKLRALPIRDIGDVEAMARLDANARKKLEVPELIADAFIAEVFVCGANSVLFNNAIASIAIQAGRAIDGDGEAIELVSQRTVMAFATDMMADKPKHRPFHWPLEFPEVFKNANSGFNCIVGNPPFLGGKRISTVMGSSFGNFLYLTNQGASKNTDLAAHFFRRSFSILAESGCSGLLATNTIAEGDTRKGGLEWLLENGATIFSAYPNEPWPGAAAVVTSRIQLIKGSWKGRITLSHKDVSFISSFLSSQHDWTPSRLRANQGQAFIGSFVNGMGFILPRDQALIMLAADSKNAEVIFPFINGDDLNSSSDHLSDRWVINFWDWSEARAKDYKLPYKWIRERVYPERLEKSKQKSYQDIMSMWWLHWRPRPELFQAIGRGDQLMRRSRSNNVASGPMRLVIAVSRHTKYFNPLFINNNGIPSDATVVFAFQDGENLAILNSNIYQAWVQKFASYIGMTIRFTPSDCYETFPRPAYGQVGLDRLGEMYATIRKNLMQDLGIGITQFYNIFHDQGNQGRDFQAVRELQVEIDCAIAHAYGWRNFDLGHGFHEVSNLPDNDRTRFTISEAASIEMLRRLADLNRQRYQEEVDQGLHDDSSARAKSVPRSKVPRATPQPSFDFGEAAANQGQYPIAAEPHRAYVSPAATAILDFLTARAGWHAKSDILVATGSPDNQWNGVINELVHAGKVERQGEKRGTRYRAVGIRR